MTAQVGVFYCHYCTKKNMKRILTFAAVIIVTAVLSITLFLFLQGESDLADGAVQEEFFSEILGEERELLIHLPRGYDSTQTYPVMFVLDGGSQDSHLANIFNVLTTASYAPQTIIVGIPNMTATNRENNLTPPFMRVDNDDINSKGGEAHKFLQFMEFELIPFITQKYHASTMRSISGNSRGGLFVMYTLLQKPDLFSARFCYSTPFWRQNNIMVSKIDSLLTTVDSLQTFIYLSAGTNETNNIKSGMANMAKTLNAAKEITLHFDYTPEAIHQNNAMLSAPAGIARWSEYTRR